MESCDICGKEFDTPQALRGHKMGAHKESVAKATKTETKQNNDNQLTPGLTTEQRAIAERVAKQDTEWFNLGAEVIADFSLMENPLDLPPEAAKHQNEKRYAFRWCERKPQRIDELTRSAQPPLRWAICTRSTTPFLAQYVDDLLGCITRLDQVLLFKPWHHHAMVQKAKQELAEIQDQSGTLEGRRGRLERDSVHAYTGDQYSIGDNDEVLADEEQVDRALGTASDDTGVGDLVVEE